MNELVSWEAGLASRRPGAFGGLIRFGGIPALSPPRVAIVGRVLSLQCEFELLGKEIQLHVLSNLIMRIMIPVRRLLPQ